MTFFKVEGLVEAAVWVTCVFPIVWIKSLYKERQTHHSKDHKHNLRQHIVLQTTIENVHLNTKR